MKNNVNYFISGLIFLIGFSSFGQNSYWKSSSSKGNLNALPISKLNPNHFKVLHINEAVLRTNLVNTPKRGSNYNKKNISIPNQNGEAEVFKVYEAPVFSQELSKKFPEIRSYIGFGIHNKAVLRMSVSPQGINTMIDYKDKPTVFMQPIKGDSNKYIVYNKLSGADDNDLSGVLCDMNGDHSKIQAKTESSSYRDADDQLLRKYRLAVAAGGEYTSYHGGTVSGALAAINTTMTRVNAIFETDMAITFEVVDAIQLIYTNPATDPYSDDLGEWTDEAQRNLTNNLGEANYDIGHLFNGIGRNGRGGCIGCVCENGSKGRGYSSVEIPENTVFDMLVAHEIGHQLAANHTFSHRLETFDVNSEPASGSTIMSYAGTVNDNNLQSVPDPYFHYQSIKQVLNNVNSSPNRCAQITPISNAPPVANAGSNYNIPAGTAYILKGNATDPNGGDALTYCWEQIDFGTIVSFETYGPTLTSGSVNRSLPPNSNPNRYIPKLSRVIAGELTEIDPTIDDDWETVLRLVEH